MRKFALRDERAPASRRAPLRTVLAATRLLPAARWVRNATWTLRFYRSNARYWFRAAQDGLPVPPFPLRILVAASPDIDWFFQSGARAADSIRSSLRRAGLQIADAGPILDFGCGCGRVIRHWAGVGVEIHGCDFNPRLIRWCARNLRFATFAVNALTPPLPYRDAQFGFVYALSVFTHLPDDLQIRWMSELRRVLRPGGHLLITTHGSHYVAELTPDERRGFESGQLVLRRGDDAGGNVCGAYHPERYVREQLAKGFSVIDFAEKGALGNPWQDAWLLRRN